MIHKIASFFIAILFMSGLAYAQGGDPLQGKEEIELTQAFQASLENLEKPELSAPQPGVKVDTEGITYEEKKVEDKTSFTPPSIKVAPPGPREVPPLYNNFVKAGFGRYSTPLLRAYFHNGRDDDSDFGLEFNHLNSFTGHLDYADFREDDGTISAKYNTLKHTAGAKLYLYNTNYFWYADTIVNERPDLKDTIRQSFTKVGFDANILKHYNETEPYYDLGVKFQGFFDRWKDQDIHVSALPSLGWNVTPNINASIKGNLTFSNSRFDSIEQGRFFLDFTPSASLNLDRIFLSAGLKINSYADSNSIFRAFPVLSGRFNAIPGKLSIVGGMKGEMHYQQYYNLISTNRWLAREAYLTPAIEKMNIYAGIEGSFMGVFNLTAKFSHQKIENQPVFYNAFGDAYFHIVYDSSFVQNTASIGLSLNKDDKIKAGINAELRSFETSTVAQYFNIPKAELNCWASYNFGNKVWLRTDVFFYGNRVMTLDTLGENVEQGPQAIVDLYVDYRFSPRISIFLELNNLLNVRYYRWYNYQERRFDIKAGVTFSF